MSKVLKAFNFDARGKRNVYPWDQWLDGRVHELRHGVDYTKGARSVISGAHSQAKKRGLVLRTSQPDDQTIVLQAILVEEHGR
jgi:hypothetical protein